MVLTTFFNMTNKFLEDQSGNKSSKRLWGSVMLGLGLCFSIVLFFYSLYQIAADSSTALNIIEALILSGTSLLGIGVIEFFKKKDDKRNDN